MPPFGVAPSGFVAVAAVVDNPPEFVFPELVVAEHIPPVGPSYIVAVAVVAALLEVVLVVLLFVAESVFVVEFVHYGAVVAQLLPNVAAHIPSVAPFVAVEIVPAVEHIGVAEHAGAAEVLRVLLVVVAVELVEIVPMFVVLDLVVVLVLLVAVVVVVVVSVVLVGSVAVAGVLAALGAVPGVVGHASASALFRVLFGSGLSGADSILFADVVGVVAVVAVAELPPEVAAVAGVAVASVGRYVLVGPPWVPPPPPQSHSPPWSPCGTRDILLLPLLPLLPDRTPPVSTAPTSG